MFSETYTNGIKGRISGVGSSVVTRDYTHEDLKRAAQEKILALLRENPELTRNALAARIGITPDSAKHHLDNLGKRSVFVTLDRPRRAAGRL